MERQCDILENLADGKDKVEMRTRADMPNRKRKPGFSCETCKYYKDTTGMRACLKKNDQFLKNAVIKEVDAEKRIMKKGHKHES